MLKAHPEITSNPAIMLGKPCIAGSRLTVEAILRRLAEGLSPAEIVAEYPIIKETDVQAAIAFAADFIASEGLVGAVAAE